MFLLKRWQKPRLEVVRHLSDGAILNLMRGRTVEEVLRLGPNEVSAFIFHEDGSLTDLGISHNLLTNAGRDLVAAALGSAGPAANTATGSSATSLTDSGESWTTDQFKGWTVFAEESTNNPVFGNIGSNSATVLTVDQWWGPNDATETTPGTTADYIILPTVRPRFMALTEDSGAAAAGDTTLASEITTGGAARALATYAHTGGTATFTLTKSYSISSSFPAVHKMGLFTAGTLTAAGIMVFETVLNADANVISGDTLQVTDTVTIS
jgi:hypothetical protein